MTSRLDRVTQSLLGLRSSVGEIPVLASWFLRQTTDPFSRALWWSIASQVGGAVLGGFIASLGMRALLRGWRDRRSDCPWRRAGSGG